MSDARELGILMRCIMLRYFVLSFTFVHCCPVGVETWAIDLLTLLWATMSKRKHNRLHEFKRTCISPIW